MSKPTNQLAEWLGHVPGRPYKYHAGTQTIENEGDAITIATIPPVGSHIHMGQLLAHCANTLPELVIAAKEVLNAIEASSDAVKNEFPWKCYDALDEAVKSAAGGDLAPEPRELPRHPEDVLADIVKEFHQTKGYWTEGLSNFIQEAEALLRTKQPTPEWIAATLKDGTIPPGLRIKRVIEAIEA